MDGFARKTMIYSYSKWISSNPEDLSVIWVSPPESAWTSGWDRILVSFRIEEDRLISLTSKAELGKRDAKLG